MELSKVMDNGKLNPCEVHQTLDRVMKQVLDLGQSSLPEKQFHAFRKMIMDFFADGKRSLHGFGVIKGRCGSSKTMAKGVVDMDG